MTSTSAEVTASRKRGRPKGAKNKPAVYRFLRDNGFTIDKLAKLQELRTRLNQLANEPGFGEGLTEDETNLIDAVLGAIE